MGKELIVVTTQLGNDGAERVLSILMNEWVKSDIKIYVIQVDPEDFKQSYKLSEEIEVINFKSKFKNRSILRAQKVIMLTNFLNKHKNATVLSFINRSTLLLYLCRRFVKNRIVFSERNNPQLKPPQKKLRNLRDQAFCAADACVFQTNEAKALFPPKAQEHGTVIINPINPNLPEKWTGERRKVVVNASRITPQKNIPMLIRAFEKFHYDFPEYTLDVYGQGEDEEKVRAMIETLGLSNYVRLCGFAENLHEQMKDASMYVCSSDYEGIPNSVLEAMALGIPTISTDCPVGGAREVIDGKNGMLVPVGDDEKLSIAMKKIASDKEFAKTLSENAYKIRDIYPIDKIAKIWLDVLFVD